MLTILFNIFLAFLIIVIVAHDLLHFLVATFLGFQHVRFAIQKQTFLGFEIPFLGITWKGTYPEWKMRLYGESGFVGSIIAIFLTALYSNVGSKGDWTYLLCCLGVFIIHFTTYTWRHANRDTNDFRWLA